MKIKFSKITSSYSREQLIDICDQLYSELLEINHEAAYDTIARNNGAYNSGPEGYYTTMSDEDIANAIRGLKQDLDVYRYEPCEPITVTLSGQDIGIIESALASAYRGFDRDERSYADDVADKLGITIH